MLLLRRHKFIILVFLMPKEQVKLEELLEEKDILVFLILKHYQLDSPKLDMLVLLNILGIMVLLLTTVVVSTISMLNIGMLWIHVLLDHMDMLGLLVDTLLVAVIYLVILAMIMPVIEPLIHNIDHMHQFMIPKSVDMHHLQSQLHHLQSQPQLLQ